MIRVARIAVDFRVSEAEVDKSSSVVAVLLMAKPRMLAPIKRDWGGGGNNDGHHAGIRLGYLPWSVSSTQDSSLQHGLVFTVCCLCESPVFREAKGKGPMSNTKLYYEEGEKKKNSFT